MSYEFLLPLETYPDPTPGAGLPGVLDFVAAVGGRLAVATHEVTIPQIGNALAEALVDVSAMIAAAENTSRAGGVALTTEVVALAAKLSIPVDQQIVYCRVEFASERIVRIARTYDITLLVRGREGASGLAEDVIFGSGGPVVLFPDHGALTHLNHVVVAWDGSRAAARAVRDALPILGKAKAVTIVTAGDDKAIDADNVVALQRLLSQHNVASDHVPAEPSSESIGRRLQQAALERGAGLLVMGAYGHSRLQEFVLGGATRDVIGNLQLPVLLSH